jgi:hypothetical protein
VPTPRLYRVLPWLAGARAGAAGHPLHRASRQGAGRVDNPEHYAVLYVSDAAAGAVAEAFGNHAVWTPMLLLGRPDLPGSVRALATFDVARIETLDLDDARRLVERELRPSAVVARDRAVTQSWALRVYREKRWAGIRWWSHYDSRWGSFGFWDVSRLKLVDIVPLAPEHSALAEAASALSRPWRERP